MSPENRLAAAVEDFAKDVYEVSNDASQIIDILESKLNDYGFSLRRKFGVYNCQKDT